MPVANAYTVEGWGELFLAEAGASVALDDRFQGVGALMAASGPGCQG